MPGQRSTDNGAQRSDFILHLDEFAADLGQTPGQMFGNLRRRRYGITGKKTQPGINCSFNTGLVALYKSYVCAHGYDLLCFHINCQVRAPEFTQFAADAIFQARRDRFFRIIQFEYFFGTKRHTYAATFAPFPIDDMLFEFRFRHKGYLASSAALRNTRTKYLTTACKARRVDIMPLFIPIVTVK
jgi:hypothetical protein